MDSVDFCNLTGSMCQTLILIGNFAGFLHICNQKIGPIAQLDRATDF